MRKKSRDRQVWHYISADRLYPGADVLPAPWFSLGSFAFTLGCVVLLVILGFVLPNYLQPQFSSLRVVGQIGLYAAAGATALPTLSLIWVRRRWGANPPTGLIGFVLLALAGPNVVLQFALWPVFPMLEQSFQGMRVWGAAVVGGGACLLAWGILVWRARVIAQLERQLQRERARADTATAERSLMESKLQVLQAQIEPHFLYNTLANVQHLIAHRPVDAEAMLTGLIRYLRESLPRMRSSCSTLEQEFTLAVAYLDIARIRLGGRLTVDMSLPSELQTFSFPPLVVQTLVENALKHGVEPKVGTATIRIEASARAEEICVTVADDGVGFGEVQGSGVGLRNTRERLAAIFGPKAVLTLAPNKPTGVVATVCIPKEHS